MMIICTYTSSWQIRELLQFDLVFYEVHTIMQLAASPIYHAFPLWGLFVADADGYWWFRKWCQSGWAATLQRVVHRILRIYVLIRHSIFLDGIRRWGLSKMAHILKEIWEMEWILNKYESQFGWMSFLINKSTFIQVNGWCCTFAKPLPEPMMT